MGKRTKILAVSISIIFILVLFNSYRKYRFENYKAEVVSKLEDFKTSHSKYPQNIDELKMNESYEMYYFSDSLKQYYTLSYSSGIINVNTTMYDSKTKEWKVKFNF